MPYTCRQTIPFYFNMMNRKLSPLVADTVPGYFKMLKNDKNLLKIIKKTPYNVYPKYKESKKRIIETPFDVLKCKQTVLNKIFQKQFPCPSYCYSGWQGKNNVKNAQQHLTMDISHFYPNSKEKFVRKFAIEKLNLADEDLELFINLTCFNGHLPTEAPTSPVLGTKDKVIKQLKRLQKSEERKQ